MLLAPIINVIDTCILIENEDEDIDFDFCLNCKNSAAALIESTLSEIQPIKSNIKKNQCYELGYTLHIPLLKLFHFADGNWTINNIIIDKMIRTICKTSRPVILYFFSNHFSTDSPIEKYLASDSRNLSKTQNGFLENSSYYGDPIYNWTFATTDNEITSRRVEAIQFFLNKLGKISSENLKKIRGVTVLGEIHHLFPNFESGMTFDGNYLITDYSEKSQSDFSSYLEKKFIKIEKLNLITKYNFLSFEDVRPPSKNAVTDSCVKSIEHIDSFAHGFFPVAGWLFIENKSYHLNSRILIYCNGHLLGKASIQHDRQDVLQAKPEFGHSQVGWRFDINFRNFSTGKYILNIFLEGADGELFLLGERFIKIINNDSGDRVDLLPLPSVKKATKNIHYYIDLPKNNSTYSYNPLAVMWHHFRQTQVVNYLNFFDHVLEKSCAANIPRYMHQILPFMNSGWDSNKFCVDKSLNGVGSLNLGVCLFGWPAYSDSFIKYQKNIVFKRYAVTEFHPMKKLNAQEMNDVLKMHKDNGADFVSFFLEPRWKGSLVKRKKYNIFSFDPSNKLYGSNYLYESIKSLFC